MVQAMTAPTAKLIDGKAIAESVRAGIRKRVADLAARGRVVRLDAVLAHSGGDAAALVYAQNQSKM